MTFIAAGSASEGKCLSRLSGMFCYDGVPSAGQTVAPHKEHFEHLWAFILYVSGEIRPSSARHSFE